MSEVSSAESCSIGLPTESCHGDSLHPPLELLYTAVTAVYLNSDTEGKRNTIFLKQTMMKVCLLSKMPLIQ